MTPARQIDEEEAEEDAGTPHAPPAGSRTERAPYRRTTITMMRRTPYCRHFFDSISLYLTNNACLLFEDTDVTRSGFIIYTDGDFNLNISASLNIGINLATVAKDTPDASDNCLNVPMILFCLSAFSISHNMNFSFAVLNASILSRIAPINSFLKSLSPIVFIIV